jgi:hypothetical protein
VQAARYATARAGVIVLHELVLDPELGKDAPPVGLEEEAPLVAMYDRLE